MGNYVTTGGTNGSIRPAVDTVEQSQSPRTTSRSHTAAAANSIDQGNSTTAGSSIIGRRRRRNSSTGPDPLPSNSNNSSSSEYEDNRTDGEVEEVSPKRKRLQTTSSYIYETLYQQGTDSNVTITALGKEWKLHKIYLCQAGYFSSMFSGRWKESSESVIDLDIPDPNITVEGLDLVFGSLYKDNITLDKTQMLSTVAAATMLQLDGLLQVCKDFMKETLCGSTVISYLDTSSMYCLKEINKQCMFWLSVHLLTSYNVALLKEIRLDVMIEIVLSSDLFVMQVEMDLYTLAKKWLFLKLHESWTGSLAKLTSSTEEFFRPKFESTGQPFLKCSEGIPYVPVFQSLRLTNILTDSASVNMVESDGIIPQKWLLPLYRDHWLKMILVEQRMDPGPNFQSDEEFGRHAVRCGRVLTAPNEYCWRWTGYSFGMDILLIYSSGLISVKRNTHSQPCVASVSLHTSRQIMLRLRVVSFTDSSLLSVASNQDTGVLRLSLGQDEGHHIMTLDKDAQFPLYISFYFSLISASETPPITD